MLAGLTGPARRRAARQLDEAIAQLARVGYSQAERVGPLEAIVRAGSGRPALRLRMGSEGKVFGGTYALELSTAVPVLPPTRGLVGRGRGVVRLRGIAFRARRGDDAGRALAARLEADDALRERLAKVHFERLRVEPDGRPVIRHMGGSVVWMLVPPLVKSVPLVPEQARATVDALLAFAEAGPRRAGHR